MTTLVKVCMIDSIASSGSFSIVFGVPAEALVGCHFLRQSFYYILNVSRFDDPKAVGSAEKYRNFPIFCTGWTLIEKFDPDK